MNSYTIVILLIGAYITGLVLWYQAGYPSRTRKRSRPVDLRARLARHQTHNRIKVAQVRSSLRSDATRLRRELEREFRIQERRDNP
jgi:hypothetical protein